MKQSQPRSMHVLMLTAQYLPEVFGGAEQQCARLSRALVKKGVKVTILTSRCRSQTRVMESDAGVAVLRPFTLFPPQTMGRYIGASFYWYLWVRRWFRRHRQEFDLVHAHQFKFQAYVGATLRRDYDLPLIVKPGNAGTHSDFESVRSKRFIGQRLCELAIAQTDRFVAISQQIDEELEHRGIPQARRCVIPNGVAQPIFRSDLARRKLRARIELRPNGQTNDLVFLYVGRFEPVKNLPVLIRAFARAVRENTARSFSLWLVGSGEEEVILKSLVADLGIASNVVFWGYRKELEPFLLAADLFILPSLAEGMSNALLEAMSSGLVPLSTPVSGSGDLITSGTDGWLLRGATPEILNEGMLVAAQATKEQLDRMSFAAFDTIANRFSIDRVADRYIELYEALHGKFKRTI